MCVLKVGAMVRIQGINGFGFIREVLYFQQSKTTVFYVEVYLHGVFQRAPYIHILPEHLEIFHPPETTAKRVLNHADDYELTALIMADEG